MLTIILCVLKRFMILSAFAENYSGNDIGYVCTDIRNG